MSNSQFLTPAKAARGLGSAKSGTHHHIGQRVSAIALVFLVPWFPVLEVIWLPGDAMVEKAEAAWYGHIHKPYRHYGVEL